jgi:serine/threonine protein kinase
MSDGIKGYFYPELSEKLFDEIRMCAGKLPLDKAQPIDDEESRGGIGEAYRAEWFKPDCELPVFPSNDNDITGETTRLCCLKVFRKLTHESDDDYAKRIYEEYDILRKACGASGRVPRPFAMGTVHMVKKNREEIRWAICMEFLPTGDGKKYFLGSQYSIKNNKYALAAGECTPLELADFAYHLCIALMDLHKKGVTHRDLHPRNIAASFVKKSDGGRGVDRIYFIDLGNSAMVEEDATTAFGDIRLAQGYYGAPEIFAFEVMCDDDSGQVLGWESKEYYDMRMEPSVDIWSFGAIVYYYSIGQKPNVVNTSGSYYQMFNLKKKKPLVLMNPTGDKSIDVLKEIVRGCTQYNPADRITLEEIKILLEDLLNIQGGLSYDLFDLDVLPESPTRRLQVGDWVLSILDSYNRVQNNYFLHEYERQIDGVTYSLMLSCDSNVKPDDRDTYINCLVEQIHSLYGNDALISEEAHPVSISRSPRGMSVHSFELLERIDDDTSFLSKHYICFLEDMALRIGIACSVSSERLSIYIIGANMNREVAEAVRSLKKI